MPLHFTRRDQTMLLAKAAWWTDSKGWRSDATALGVYADAEQRELAAVAVFQNIDAYGAEFHFAMMPGHLIGRDIMEGIMQVAMINPRGFQFPMVWAPIPASNVRAQVIALRLGFQFEHRKRGSATGQEDAIVFSFRRREASEPSAGQVSETEAA
jgi:hypothetical protein